MRPVVQHLGVVAVIEITHRILRQGTPGKPDYREQDWFMARSFDATGRLAYAERGTATEAAEAVFEYLVGRLRKDKEV